jgi:tryptophanyl-tRNA synthetase
VTTLPDHYATVRERNDYEPVDGAVGPVPAAERRRFVAVDDAEGVLAGSDDLAEAEGRDRSGTLVATGAGMTGPPHLGTVGQFLTAVALQEAGLDVQFVLADLEPYHTGAPLDRVRRLAERYRAFALGLGFDADRGRLRTQSEARDVMHTAQLLAPHYDPEAWAESGSNSDPPRTEWERAVREAYETAEGDRGPGTAAVARSGPTSEAADAHSAVLHGVDFLHPLYAGEYERLVLQFGVDEHHLTGMARRFRDAAPVDGDVAGLYTRMLPGFDGAPKMAKSIPGSGVSLAMAPEEIRERIASDPGGDPDRSPVFQSMCLASRYGADRLDRPEAACEAGGEAWKEARAEYAEFVVGLAERWRATGG